jgi:hypothetical protein
MERDGCPNVLAGMRWEFMKTIAIQSHEIAEERRSNLPAAKPDANRGDGC